MKHNEYGCRQAMETSVTAGTNIHGSHLYRPAAVHGCENQRKYLNINS